MAVLILLDISGSMFGNKLSLAKVSGLEMFRNLKSDDRVGLHALLRYQGMGIPL